MEDGRQLMRELNKNARAIHQEDRSSLFNRVKSVFHDAEFVSGVVEDWYPLPVVANLRCGFWYVTDVEEVVERGLAALVSTTCYFKSTDGHPGAWDFSLRRLNLHVAAVAAEQHGCILVDSTIRGRSMPDSFAKTVPIWCVVLNRALLRYKSAADASNWDTSFHSLPDITPPSEVAQIEDKIDGWVEKLLESKVKLEGLAITLVKPLRPIWVSPTRACPQDLNLQDLPYTPIVLCCASEPVRDSASGTRRTDEGYTYIQGAGGDEEGWSQGLTPYIMWSNYDTLAACSRDQFAELVAELVRLHASSAEADHTFESVESHCDRIGKLNLFVGSRLAGRPPQCWQKFDAVVCCTLDEYDENKGEDHKDNYLFLPIPEGKRDKMELITLLPRAIAFIFGHLSLGHTVLIHCAQGKDRSVAVCAAVLARHYDDNLNALAEPCASVNRALITRRLLTISVCRPLANPSRATVKKLYQFFDAQS